MSFSHCLRKESLSKVGSAFTISVSTSDISVLEKRPPGKKTEGRKINSRNTFIYEINSQHEVCLLLSATQWGDSTSYGGALPRKSVTLSVIALDALMRALSLSSYFIFISKNPVGNNRRQTFFGQKVQQSIKTCSSEGTWASLKNNWTVLVYHASHCKESAATCCL